MLWRYIERSTHSELDKSGSFRMFCQFVHTYECILDGSRVLGEGLELVVGDHERYVRYEHRATVLRVIQLRTVNTMCDVGHGRCIA